MENQQTDVIQKKTINPHIYTVSLWGTMIAGLIIAVMSSIQMEIILLLPAIGIIVSQLYLLISLYRCWKILQESTARITPGMAVGFLFFPLFNLYWMFPVIRGLAKDSNAFLQLKGIGKNKISVMLSTLTCVMCILIIVCILLMWIRLTPQHIGYYAFYIVSDLQIILKDVVAYFFYVVLALENVLLYYWARFFNFAVEELGVEYK